MDSLRILYVEDDPTWIEALQNILVSPKFQLVTAKSYGEAINKLSGKYDLAIINLCLAGDFDFLGEDLLKELAGRNLPCIVVTGTGTSMRGLFERYGVFNVFVKGRNFNQRDLLLEIENAVSQSQPKQPQQIEEYVDFELYIDKDNNVHASSSEGERSGTISLASLNAIELAMRLIEQEQTTEPLLRDFGKQLYDAIFPAPIHMHLNQTESAARIRGQNVRIRLIIQSDVLITIPWEFAYREEGGYFLAINPKTVLSRYVNLPLPHDHVQHTTKPLHLLVIIAAPSNLPFLDTNDWEKCVTRALEIPLRNGEITIQVLKKASTDEIGNVLLINKPDIVQFIGHGIYRNGKGYLALVNHETNNVELIDDAQFAALLLGSDDHLGLVCLAACESAMGESTQSFLGLAPKIVQKGIPAVIAMQYSVQISSAATFLENFYKAIAARKPVDWAVQAGRRAISLKKGFDNREFATPVLYMRARDGSVF